jgi:hypothetical protein
MPMPAGPYGATTGSGAHVPVVKATVPIGATTPQPGAEPRAASASTSSPFGLVLAIFAIFALVGGGAGLFAWKQAKDKKLEASTNATAVEPPPPASTVPPAVASAPAPASAAPAEPPPAATAAATTATARPAHTSTKRPPSKPVDPPDPGKTAPAQKPPPPPPTATASADPLGTNHR